MMIAGALRKDAPTLVRTVLTVAIFLFETACSAVHISPAEVDRAPAGGTPTDVWIGLHAQTPQPHTTPLPDPERSPVDGSYAKVDPGPPQWWACRRCADYRPAGGAWKLSFDRGVMRIFYEIPLWRSLASFKVSEDRMVLFNDVVCPQDVGEYKWSIDDRQLKIELVEDPCSFGLRAENLTKQTWSICQAPNGISSADEGSRPLGCEPDPQPQELRATNVGELAVEEIRGLAYKADIPPEVIVAAGLSAQDNPESIHTEASDDSITYGRSVVLWKEGGWVEATSESSFEAMGIQFHGDYTIGWASVYFDGVEVWRGDTSRIWSHLGRHGGYIQISGYEPGLHTIRAESLAIDYRPVVVEFFGYGQVESQP